MDNVSDVFSELKKRGLITNARRVAPSSNYPNFKMRRCSTILYNPKFANLDHEVLRFILLHEEAHCHRRQNSHLAIWVILFLFAFSEAVLVYGTRSDTELMKAMFSAACAIYIPFLVFFARIFETPIQADEYDADIRAARIMKKEYLVHKPSDLIERSLREMRESDHDDSLLLSIYLLLYGGMHPSDKERVGRIKSLVDDS